MASQRLFGRLRQRFGLRVENRVPERAAQAAAGIANAGFAAGATITCAGGPPRSLSRTFAIVAAASGPAPWIRVVWSPSGAAASPIANAWAPCAGPEPAGSSDWIASSVASGTSSAFEISSGALIGSAISTEAATALCQSASSTRTTASGRCSGACDGNTASATPAAFEAGSAPPTLVVLLVANPGKPISSGDSVSTGSGVVASGGLVVVCSPPGAAPGIELLSFDPPTIAATMKIAAIRTSAPKTLIVAGSCRRSRSGGPGGGGSGLPPGTGTSALIGWLLRATKAQPRATATARCDQNWLVGQLTFQEH